jgi:Fanconi-associated nuclease 1
MEPDVKRRKTAHNGETQSHHQSPLARLKSYASESSVSSDTDHVTEYDVSEKHDQATTGIEKTLPDIAASPGIIAKYENEELTGQAVKSEVETRSHKSNAVLHRSSIYLDAFNLALNTVLEEESPLFSKRELAVFKAWESLDYEAQYLLVMALFILSTQC